MMSHLFLVKNQHFHEYLICMMFNALVKYFGIWGVCEQNSVKQYNVIRIIHLWPDLRKQDIIAQA